MKIIRNSRAYEIAVKAATGAIVDSGELTSKGKPKFIKDDTKLKTWFTTRNKKGAKAIKEIAIVLEEFFRDEKGDFNMPNFTKVHINAESGYIELVTKDNSIEDTVIIKPEADSE